MSVPQVLPFVPNSAPIQMVAMFVVVIQDSRFKKIKPVAKVIEVY